MNDPIWLIPGHRAAAIAALLHEATTRIGWASCVHSSENEWLPFCEVAAARLIAAGVTVATPPADEPSCCELACYEDPGCACEGCTNPAEHLGPDDHGHTGRLWCDPCVAHGVAMEQGIHRCAPTPDPLREALERLDLLCENYLKRGKPTHDACRINGRKRDGEYADGRWCLPCEVRAALIEEARK